MPTALDRALLNDNGTGTDFDLAATDYKTTAIAIWERARIAWDLVTKQVVTGRKYDEFVRTYILEDEDHVPGAEIVGQTLEKANLIVGMEDHERIAMANQTNVDRFVTHYNHRQALATEAGRALARTADKHVLQEIVVGARASAVGSFPTGSRTVRSGATIAEAYPMTVAGSRALQEDITTTIRGMFENDLPEDSEIHAFIGFYLHQVLRMDDSLLSEDYVDRALADKIEGKLLRVAGAWIHRTNNMPTTDLSENTTPTVGGTVVYAADFSTTAAVIHAPDAIAGVWTGSIAPSADWLPNRRVVQIGAALLKGLKFFRAEACGEVYISGA